MKEHPIIFSSDSIRAILEGRKTQTRRVTKQNALLERQIATGIVTSGVDYSKLLRFCPYGQPGDRLWVRETWGYPDNMNPGNDAVYISYIADKTSMFVHFKTGEKVSVSGYAKPLKLKPSIFMPRWASRITLEIVSVRVERVQDIHPLDCVAEGASTYDTNISLDTHINRFKVLWNSINAKRGYSWESNPWVWVIEFKRVEG